SSFSSSLGAHRRLSTPQARGSGFPELPGRRRRGHQSGAEHDAPPVPWRASVQLAVRVVFEGEPALFLHDGVKRPRESGSVFEVDGSAVSERLRDSGIGGAVGGASGAVAGHRFLLPGVAPLISVPYVKTG